MLTWLALYLELALVEVYVLCQAVVTSLLFHPFSMVKVVFLVHQETGAGEHEQAQVGNGLFWEIFVLKNKSLLLVKKSDSKQC